MLDRLARQLRYALRVLARSPLYAVTATLSLAIGLGANTTIFTIANALLLVPTHGVRDMNELVDIGRTDNGQGFDTVSYPTYTDLRDQSTVFSGMYAIRNEPKPASLGAADGADRAYSQQVSASYFEVLGIQPAAGRFFQNADERLGVPLRQTVMSYAFWQHRFAGDPSVVGRDLVLNGDHFTVVGIAPQSFTGNTIVTADLWVPLTSYAQAMPSDSLLRGRENAWLLLGGRLKPGVTITQARTEMTALMSGLVRRYPDAYPGKGIAVAAASRLPGMAGDFVVPFIGVLSVVVGLVLLIACTNLAGIMLARAASRAREVAVRLALGASRGELVAQFLTETLIVFAIGGVAAVLVSRVMTGVLTSFLPTLPVPIAVDFALDTRVLLFSTALALATGVLTGAGTRAPEHARGHRHRSEAGVGGRRTPSPASRLHRRANGLVSRAARVRGALSARLPGGDRREARLRHRSDRRGLDRSRAAPVLRRTGAECHRAGSGRARGASGCRARRGRRRRAARR